MPEGPGSSDSPGGSRLGLTLGASLGPDLPPPAQETRGESPEEWSQPLWGGEGCPAPNTHC